MTAGKRKRNVARCADGGAPGLLLADIRIEPHSRDISEPSCELSSIKLVPLPFLREPSFDLTHSYVELVYGPILGPAAVLLARHFGRRVAASNGPVDVDLAEIALDLGLRSKNAGPMGKRSPLRKALDRIEHVRFVRWLDEDTLGVATGVPALSPGARQALPQTAVNAHEMFTRTNESVRV